jgi:hypothetical protein
MRTNKAKGSNLFDRLDEMDVSTFGGFLNSILRQHFPQKPGNSPPNNPELEFRTIDGSGNNLADPGTGEALGPNEAGSAFSRVGPAHFAGDDGVTPIDNVNARTVSNVVLGQGEPIVPDGHGLSGMMHAWGQFLDHDLDLIRSGTEPFNIVVPDGDPQLGDGAIIAVNRSAMEQGTGTPENPATAINRITGWIDASMVYGSDVATAANLRLPDGHLATSEGGNLLIVNGRFQAGDVRAAETPPLTALQTLFVREHNFQVDRLMDEHPEWTGDQLYQHARAIVGAEIAHITYDEFLPHLLGPHALSRYKGYDPNVDPTITEEFAGAAYRFGHSTVSPETAKLDELGQAIGPTIQLRDAFGMAPADFASNGGADGILRHLGADHAMAMDGRIIEELRNFLVDGPTRVDLAAINIQRGRDLGLGTLNETREALGLKPYKSIDQITNDPGTRAALKEAYGEDGVNNIDLWVGGLAEKHAPGAMVGKTFQTIIGMQFEALRDGDRLWYEIQGFDKLTLNEIKGTTLADIIERNTDTQNIQDDVFVYYDRHSGALGDIGGEDPNAPQLVIGSEGADALVGGRKGDMLVAADGGLQTMSGKNGADQFIFGHDMEARITDFRPGVDKVVFEDAGEVNGFRDLSIRSDHGNAVIEANGNQIVLMGVRPYQLHSHDFIYES